MNKGINNFLKGLNQGFIKIKFTNLKSDKSNIDEIYNNNINIWYYFNSDTVTKKDGNKEVRSKLDTINNVILLNPENFIFCKTQNGFILTEDDFINSELKRFEELEINKLSITENKQYTFYKDYLINKLEQPQKKGDNKNDEVNEVLHNNYFKGNTFKLWERYKENKQITASSKADLRVIFELMKDDNYLQETVELKHYIQFLNTYYFDGNISELKIQYLDSKPNIQRAKDYNEYKTNLKLTLK